MADFDLGLVQPTPVLGRGGEVVLQIAQHEKAVDTALGMTHRHWVRYQRASAAAIQ